MAAGAPTRSLDVAVALPAGLARLLDAEEVRRVAEGTELVRGVNMVVVNVFMTFKTIRIHHKRFGRNELGVGGARLGWLEILLAVLGTLRVPLARVLHVHDNHGGDESDDDDAKAGAPTPFNVGAGPAVHDV